MNTYNSRRYTASSWIIATMLAASAIAQEGPAAAPKFLYNENPSLSAGKIADAHATLTVTPRNGGLDVVVAGSPEGYPGFAFVPSSGTVWDLSAWGHVKAKVTNTGTVGLMVSMRVDNNGEWKDSPWNTESIYLKPGESKFLKVIFGYQYGYQLGYKLKTDAVSRVLIFTGQSNKERSFRIEDLLAGGAKGDRPPVDPNSVSERPKGGQLLALAPSSRARRSLKQKREPRRIGAPARR